MKSPDGHFAGARKALKYPHWKYTAILSCMVAGSTTEVGVYLDQIGAVLT
jgi:hypothetical protein